MATTWDAVNISSGLTLSNGNLTVTSTGVSSKHTRATSSQSTGKYYMECNADVLTAPTGAWGLGLQNSSALFTHFLGETSDSIAWYDDGTVYRGGSVVATIASFVQGNLLCMAVDTTARRAWFRVGAGNWNNDILANQNPATGTGGIDISALTGALFPGNEPERNTDAGTANFGATAYAQAVPSSFLNWDGSSPSTGGFFGRAYYDLGTRISNV